MSILLPYPFRVSRRHRLVAQLAIGVGGHSRCDVKSGARVDHYNVVSGELLGDHVLYVLKWLNVVQRDCKPSEVPRSSLTLLPLPLVPRAV